MKKSMKIEISIKTRAIMLLLVAGGALLVASRSGSGEPKSSLNSRTTTPVKEDTSWNFTPKTVPQQSIVHPSEQQIVISLPKQEVLFKGIKTNEPDSKSASNSSNLSVQRSYPSPYAAGNTGKKPSFSSPLPKTPSNSGPAAMPPSVPSITNNGAVTPTSNTTSNTQRSGNALTPSKGSETPCYTAPCKPEAGKKSINFAPQSVQPKTTDQKTEKSEKQVSDMVSLVKPEPDLATSKKIIRPNNMLQPKVKKLQPSVDLGGTRSKADLPSQEPETKPTNAPNLTTNQNSEVQPSSTEGGQLVPTNLEEQQNDQSEAMNSGNGGLWDTVKGVLSSAASLILPSWLYSKFFGNTTGPKITEITEPAVENRQIADQKQQATAPLTLKNEPKVEQLTDTKIVKQPVLSVTNEQPKPLITNRTEQKVSVPQALQNEPKVEQVRDQQVLQITDKKNVKQPMPVIRNEPELPQIENRVEIKPVEKQLPVDDAQLQLVKSEQNGDVAPKFNKTAAKQPRLVIPDFLKKDFENFLTSDAQELKIELDVTKPLAQIADATHQEQTGMALTRVNTEGLVRAAKVKKLLINTGAILQKQLEKRLKTAGITGGTVRVSLVENQANRTVQLVIDLKKTETNQTNLLMLSNEEQQPAVSSSGARMIGNVSANTILGDIAPRSQPKTLLNDVSSKVPVSKQTMPKMIENKKQPTMVKAKPESAIQRPGVELHPRQQAQNVLTDISKKQPVEKSILDTIRQNAQVKTKSAVKLITNGTTETLSRRTATMSKRLALPTSEPQKQIKNAEEQEKKNSKIAEQNKAVKEMTDKDLDELINDVMETEKVGNTTNNQLGDDELDNIINQELEELVAESSKKPQQITSGTSTKKLVKQPSSQPWYKKVANVTYGLLTSGKNQKPQITNIFEPKNLKREVLGSSPARKCIHYGPETKQIGNK